MKRYTIAAFLALLLASLAPAQSKGSGGGAFGLGVILGEPTGLSAKLRLNGANAIDMGLAWAFKNQLLAVHADYLLSFPGLVVVEGEDFPPFVGIGAYVHAIGSTDSVNVGIRFPLGISYRFKAVPIELSLEVVPGFEIIPQSGFALQGGLAIRWYF